MPPLAAKFWVRQYLGGDMVFLACPLLWGFFPPWLFYLPGVFAPVELSCYPVGYRYGSDKVLLADLGCFVALRRLRFPPLMSTLLWDIPLVKTI